MNHVYGKISPYSKNIQTHLHAPQKHTYPITQNSESLLSLTHNHTYTIQTDTLTQRDTQNNTFTNCVQSANK
jgi:hypothetical protein